MTKPKPKKIEPRGKQILVLVDPEESRVSEYGIAVPDEVEQERKSIGVVESFGPEVKDMKIGDRVLYGAYAGEVLKLNSEGKKIEYRVLEDADVIAFIR